MDPLIRSVRRYRGDAHPWAVGKRVVVVRVVRADSVLENDPEIGELQPDDLIEFAPIVVEAGRERMSWVLSDAQPWDLGPAEGRWTGAMQDWIVVSPK